MFSVDFLSRKNESYNFANPVQFLTLGGGGGGPTAVTAASSQNIIKS